MNESIESKYIELILKNGISIQEGQCISIACDPIHWEFVNKLTKRAYELGAKYVRADLNHAYHQIARTNFSKKEFLTYVPTYQKSMTDTYVNEKWSLIRFDGAADPDINKQMNQDSNSIITKSMLEVTKPLRDSIMSGANSWTIAALPTQKWAAKILGVEPSQDAVNKLWEVMIPIMRLDQENPTQAWIEHGNNLAKRSKFLTENQFDYLHFVSKDTDLKIYMNQGSKWEGGAMKNSAGHTFFPNLPTEEVFTAPDFRKTVGKVKVTRPVNVLGDQVEGGWFEFQDGVVTNYGADYGKHLLDKYFEIDPKARALGEVALVDCNSPIFTSRKVFHSILFDENASCHIALGRGIASAIEGGKNMSEEELLKHGCNMSLLHTDFMIGSNDLDVVGVKKNGDKVTIIKQGNFTI